MAACHNHLLTLLNYPLENYVHAAQHGQFRESDCCTSIAKYKYLNEIWLNFICILTVPNINHACSDALSMLSSKLLQLTLNVTNCWHEHAKMRLSIWIIV